MSDPRFPIGDFAAPAEYTPALRSRFISEMEAAPALLREAVRGLSVEQLRTPYRAGGWSVAQVVHHVPDSHLNSYVRFKMAVTEDAPAIKTYEESRWAQLPDAEDPATVEESLALLASLHTRWVRFLRGLSDADFGRTYRHPEMGLVTLDRALAIYAWHGRHHTAHVTALREHKGW